MNPRYTHFANTNITDDDICKLNEKIKSKNFYVTRIMSDIIFHGPDAHRYDIFSIKKTMFFGLFKKDIHEIHAFDYPTKQCYLTMSDLEEIIEHL